MTEILQYQIIMGIQAVFLVIAMIIISRQESQIKKLKAKLPTEVQKRDVSDQIRALYSGSSPMLSLYAKQNNDKSFNYTPPNPKEVKND